VILKIIRLVLGIIIIFGAILKYINQPLQVLNENFLNEVGGWNLFYFLFDLIII